MNKEVEGLLVSWEKKNIIRCGSANWEKI